MGGIIVHAAVNSQSIEASTALQRPGCVIFAARLSRPVLAGFNGPERSSGQQKSAGEPTLFRPASNDAYCGVA
jgi:hypothetical protein